MRREGGSCRPGKRQGHVVPLAPTLQPQNVEVGPYLFRSGFRFLVRLKLSSRCSCPRRLTTTTEGQRLTPSSAEAVVPPIEVFSSPKTKNLIQEDLA